MVIRYIGTLFDRVHKGLKFFILFYFIREEQVIYKYITLVESTFTLESVRRLWFLSGLKDSDPRPSITSGPSFPVRLSPSPLRTYAQLCTQKWSGEIFLGLSWNGVRSCNNFNILIFYRK